MDITKRKPARPNRKVIFAGLLLGLVLPALFSAKTTASFSPQSTRINSALDFSTYFGSDQTDDISAIATDRDGNVYVTGSASRSLQTTQGAFQAAPSSGSGGPFVAKIDPRNRIIVYSTFLAGFSSRVFDIAVDLEGNAYVCGSTSEQNFPVTPGAVQTNKGNGTYAFVTKLNATGSALLYSTYFGGSGTGAYFGECGSFGCLTEATAVKVDPEGNVYITGGTNSDLLPITDNAFQKNRVRSDCSGGGDVIDPVAIACRDAFVAKLNPLGSALVYCTYLGGRGNDSANGIALDASGNAYVTGTASPDFPLTAPIASEGPMFVTKLNADGSGLVYSRRVDGGIGPADIDVGPAGNAYLTSITNSVNLGTTSGAFRPTSSNALAFRSSDGGGHWNTSHRGLSQSITVLAVNPADPTNVFAASYSGILRSTDSGATWMSPLSTRNVQSLIFDTQNPANAYAVYFSFVGGTQVTKTTDAGRTWSDVNRPSSTVLQFVTLILDPTDSSVVYGTFVSNIDQAMFKTTNGGQNWEKIGNGLPDKFGTVLGVSPSNPSILFASSNDDVHKSTDGGRHWSATSLGDAAITTVVFDPLDRSVVYAVGGGIYRSGDVGQTWEKIDDNLPDVTVDRLFIDPTASSTMYANTPSGVFKSGNAGRTWLGIDADLNRCSKILAIDPRNPKVLYVGGCYPVFEVFAVKINAQGTAFDYLTYLGEGNLGAIAVDAAGNAYITGSTGSAAFPVRNAFQPDLRSSGDAFLVKLNRTGTDVAYSTYFGGTGSDTSAGVALDSAGRAWIAGTTYSNDIGMVNPLQANLRGPSDAFLAAVIEANPTVPAPKLSSVNPPAGPSSGGTEVAISGENFDAQPQVRIGGLSAEILSAQPSLIRAKTLAHFIGPVVVAVVNTDGQSAVAAAGFTYLPSPRVDRVFRSGNELDVSGAEFDKNATILVNRRERKSRNDPTNPTSQLLSKKALKRIEPGQTVVIEVRNADGITSPAFSYTRP